MSDCPQDDIQTKTVVWTLQREVLGPQPLYRTRNVIPSWIIALRQPPRTPGDSGVYQDQEGATTPPIPVAQRTNVTLLLGFSVLLAHTARTPLHI